LLTGCCSLPSATDPVLPFVRQGKEQPYGTSVSGKWKSYSK
jgi:hypothetical protein